MKRFFLMLLFTVLCAVEASAGLGDVLDDRVLETSPRDCAVIKVCKGDAPVTLSDLPGRFVLIEAFSMYCPFCQATAPQMNELAGLITASRHSGEIIMIGLGAGNSRFEVDFFRDKYKIPFAVFPDQDMEFYHCVGDPGTPYTVLAEKTGKGLVVRWAHLGPIKNPGAAFDEILAAAGLKK